MLEGPGSKNEEEAYVNFDAAAKMGHPKAYNLVGICYLKGQGTPKNLPEAVRMFSKGMHLMNAEAINNLGLCYD